MTVRYFGIRHHGAGSARHLLAALRDFRPDHILLEAPPEAASVLHLLGEDGMKPPVALLAYRPDSPKHAVYYPFAEFSPEWQTLQYARDTGTALTPFDLPLAHSLHDTADETAEPGNRPARPDPFDYLAELSGSLDGESYWENLVEQRLDGQDLFEAVRTAVSALREALPEYTRPRDLLREAHMRKILRQTVKTAARTAVVCGAWHVPALAAAVAAKDDNALLKGLPKCKTACTWIPWTNTRLTFASGYGAGIAAPEWYAHLWRHPEDDGTLWTSRLAALLRRHGSDVSSAHIIETVRLAQTAAALRGQSRVRLPDWLEAATAVIGMGDAAVLDTVRHALLVGDAVGSVPDNAPQPPLPADVEQQRKKLRLPQSAESKLLELDLRKDNDLQKSIFLHRLNVLDTGWATAQHSRSQGTFKEHWLLCYQPEQYIVLTERAVYGNTLAAAASAYAAAQAENGTLADLMHLLQRALPADLPELLTVLTEKVENLSADSRDVGEMLAALPPLAEILRYGTVRGLDNGRLFHLLRVLAARLAAGGVQGCLNIAAEPAQTLFRHICAADYRISLLDDADTNGLWLTFLRAQAAAQHAHALLRGNAVRLLFERGELTAGEAAQRFSQTLSPARNDTAAADWLQGFLHQAGTALLVHDGLWKMVDDWLGSLNDDAFRESLPLLRRTFATFASAEKRQLGDKARHGSTAAVKPDGLPFDEAGAARAETVVSAWLGWREFQAA